MAAQQIDPILASKIRFRPIHLECHALLVEAQTARTPIVAVLQDPTRTTEARVRADDPVGPFVVAIHKELAVRRQQLRQPAFLLGHARQIAEEFQVLAADAGDDAIARPDHLHQRRQVRPGDSCPLPAPPPDAIVSSRSNVNGTPMSLLKLASLQSVASFCRSTDATSSFVVVLPFEPPRPPSAAESLSDTPRPTGRGPCACPRPRSPRSRPGSPALARVRPRSPPPLSLAASPQKLVPIEPFARQSKEQVARLHLARIRAYAVHERFRRTAQQFAGAGRSDKSQRASFHAEHGFGSASAARRRQIRLGSWEADARERA